MIRPVGHIAQRWNYICRGLCNNLVDKPQGNKPLGRHYLTATAFAPVLTGLSRLRVESGAVFFKR